MFLLTLARAVGPALGASVVFIPLEVLSVTHHGNAIDAKGIGMSFRAVGGWLLVVLGVGASWLFGAVIVRVGLDWSDTFPYSEASEWRYLGVAVLALSVAVAGTVVSVLMFRSVQAARRRACHDWWP